jgi:Fe2+ transport system protein FeoA
VSRKTPRSIGNRYHASIRYPAKSPPLLKLNFIFNYDILSRRSGLPLILRQSSVKVEKHLGAAVGSTNVPAPAPVPLDALPRGAQARVVRMEGDGPVAKRLMEMGIVPGAPVSVVRSAPLGDPIEIRVRGYHLALRRSEARTITVISDEQGRKS